MNYKSPHRYPTYESEEKSLLSYYLLKQIVAVNRRKLPAFC